MMCPSKRTAFTVLLSIALSLPPAAVVVVPGPAVAAEPNLPRAIGNFFRRLDNRLQGRTPRKQQRARKPVVPVRQAPELTTATRPLLREDAMGDVVGLGMRLAAGGMTSVPGETWLDAYRRVVLETAQLHRALAVARLRRDALASAADRPTEILEDALAQVEAEMTDLTARLSALEPGAQPADAARAGANAAYEALEERARALDLALQRAEDHDRAARQAEVLDRAVADRPALEQGILDAVAGRPVRENVADRVRQVLLNGNPAGVADPVTIGGGQAMALADARADESRDDEDAQQVLEAMRKAQSLTLALDAVDAALAALPANDTPMAELEEAFTAQRLALEAASARLAALPADGEDRAARAVALAVEAEARLAAEAAQRALTLARAREQLEAEWEALEQALSEARAVEEGLIGTALSSQLDADAIAEIGELLGQEAVDGLQ